MVRNIRGVLCFSLLCVVVLTQNALTAQDEGVITSRTAVNSDDAYWAFQGANPKVKFYEQAGRIGRVYGSAFSHGVNAEASAESFVQKHAQMFGVRFAELSPRGPLADGRHSIPLMYDDTTNNYKFTLVYYAQEVAGIPVFRSDLRVLVRNEPGNPAVLAASSLRDIGHFAINPAAGVGAESGHQTARTAFPQLTRFSAARLVIFAGVDDVVSPATLAYEFMGSGDAGAMQVARRLFVTDASTGQILHDENLIHHVEVEGTVMGMATEGIGADICEEETLQAMPYARVSADGIDTFADEFGNFSISGVSPGEVEIVSPVSGRWFTVDSVNGADDVVTLNITPDGPVEIIHNEENGSETIRSQTNTYIGANIIRDFVLQFNPAYPTLGNESFPVYVNRTDGFCPGNAWYDPAEQSINFCRSGGGSPTTSWTSIIYHEYGHHLVAAAGSGQGQYGEGMGDTMSVLILDDPNIGIGFFGNCGSALRSAISNLQYPCSGSGHNCASLISGAVWDTRNELVVTEPDDYMNVLSNIAVNAMLLHSGSQITPQITIDYVTLDDDDGTIDNGTPHYAEINTGFGAHNMPAPPLALLAISYPQGQPLLSHPTKGAELLARIESVAGQLDEDNPPLLIASADGEPFETIEMVTTGELDMFSATLPPSDCFSTVRWYISAQTTSAQTITSPSNAPAGTFDVFVATDSETVVAFDFEENPGFVVSGDADDGNWDRGIPVNCNRGDPPSDFDGSGRCWLTDNSTSGCNSDVDGGSAILMTGVLDMGDEGVEYFVDYARWYSNTFGAEPESDVFVVEISNNNGDSWENLETVGPSGPEIDGGWFFVSHSVNEVLDPTDQMRVRFIAFDSPASGSVIEAAIDTFSVNAIGCEDSDTVLPFVVHDGGVTTSPFSGYIDSRNESSNGTDLDLGIDTVWILFSEPVRDIDAEGGGLTDGSFAVVSSGPNTPSVETVDDSQNPLVKLTLSSTIQPGQWTTILIDVVDIAGNPILNLGDLGADNNEPDRIDIGFLPCDVDQSGTVQALDLLRFRQMSNGVFENPLGVDEDYIDIDRNGSNQPLDLLRFRQLFLGSGNATQAWSGASLPNRP